jgi:hypothetical protein
MTTVAMVESSFPVHWIKHPKVNASAWLLVATAMVLPVVFALSLPGDREAGIWPLRQYTYLGRRTAYVA